MGWSILLGGIVVNVAGVIGIEFAQHAQHQTLSLFGYAAYFVGFVVISCFLLMTCKNAKN